MSKKRPKSDPFATSPAAIEVLRQTQWIFRSVDKLDTYELRLKLASPAIITPTKADIPIPGLPTLDGFLSFVAFRAALDGALKIHPELANELLWQWNAALRNSSLWVRFSLPLRQTRVETAEIYDCSVGLPVVNGRTLIPAGAFFAYDRNLVTYPETIDSIALRRRVSLPAPRPMDLSSKLNTGSGKNKALNSQMYYALTDEFAFYFRGNKLGVERLLEFAKRLRIGIGKKTTLGYGQIADFKIDPVPGISATLAQPILEGQNLALVKTLPYDAVLATRTNADSDLFGCDEFRLMNATETVGAYQPPYWRRETQTQVLLYGTTLIKVK